MDVTSAGAMDITTSAGNSNIAIDPNGSGTLALGSADNTAATVDAIAFSIDATGGASNISLAADGAGDDLTIAVSGSQDASLVLSSAGTGADAVQLSASAGGMDVTSAGAMDITTSASNSNITIDPNGSGTLALGSADNASVTADALAITATSVNALTLTDGTASFALGGTGATTLSAATTIDLDGTGAMSLNSSSGAINVGNDADAQAINIGTGSAARTMTVGNTTGATSVTINSGTGDIALTSTDKVTISASSGSQTDGTGGVVDFNGSEIENFKASIYEDSDNHSLTASENGKIIVFTSDSDIVLTVPTSLAIGFNCLIVQEGEGAVTITASGTTVRNRNDHVKTAGQYAVMSLFSYTTNVFISSGDGAL